MFHYVYLSYLLYAQWTLRLLSCFGNCKWCCWYWTSFIKSPGSCSYCPKRIWVRNTTEVVLVVKNLPANIGDKKDEGSIPVRDKTHTHTHVHTCTHTHMHVYTCMHTHMCTHTLSEEQREQRSSLFMTEATEHTQGRVWASLWVRGTL